MHDLAAVRTLVDHLTARLSTSDLERVEEVRIAADGTRSVAALRLAYEVVTKDTPLDGSTLVVDLRARSHRCPTCERTSPVALEDLVGHLTICPRCGAMSAVESGDGIELVALTSRDSP